MNNDLTICVFDYKWNENFFVFGIYNWKQSLVKI